MYIIDVTSIGTGDGALPSAATAIMEIPALAFKKDNSPEARLTFPTFRIAYCKHVCGDKEKVSKVALFNISKDTWFALKKETKSTKESSRQFVSRMYSLRPNNRSSRPLPVPCSFVSNPICRFSETFFPLLTKEKDQIAS